MAEPFDGYDPEEESEDLFDFDELRTPMADGGSQVYAAVADSIDLGELVDALPDLSEGVAALAVDDDHLPERDAHEEFDDFESAGEVRRAEQELSERRPVRFSPALILSLIGLTVLNLGLVGLSWSTNRRLERTVADVGRSVIHTAEGLRDDTAERSRELSEIVKPIVSPDTSEGQTFTLARDDMERGDFGMARRRLYGLLAVADSLDAKVRSDAEAQASFLIAESYVSEARALQREEAP